MSTLWLKGIALLTMTIDHLGLVFGWEGWNRIPMDSSYLRAIGRIAFPLFAFCLAQGWHRTHSQKRYFIHITWGAVASQVPFSMAFYAPNLTMVPSDSTQIQVNETYLLFACAAVWVYWYFILQKEWEFSLAMVAAAAVLPGIRIQIHGFWILCENTNVFYTFLMAFFCLYVLDHLMEFDFVQRAALCIAGPVLLLAYGLPADYGTGLLGIVLILGFAILPRKGQQAIFLVLWSVLFYGFLAGNLLNTVCCALASVGILLYNSRAQSRLRAKKFFYWYYPVHLLALGLWNAGMHHFG